MNNYVIKDFELNTSVKVRGQGVAEVIFDYLPWPTFDATISFKNSEGWFVIDNRTGFKYEITPA